MDTNKLSTWASILGIPALVAWYITGYQTVASSLRTSPNSSLPVIFMGAFVLFGVIALAANAATHSKLKKLNAQQQLTPNAEATPRGEQPRATSPTDTRNVDDFLRTFDNALILEAEALIRRDSDRYSQGDARDRYLIRSLAATYIIGLFETTYLNIFGSQIQVPQPYGQSGIWY